MEIKIILILLFVHYLQLYIVKPKHNKLYCGIFAWAGKDVSKFSKSKFDILGIYNIDRGRDSCGVAVDGVSHKGINLNKLYTDFIKNHSLYPKKFPTVIGHTRQASAGNIVNLDNVHPFTFGITNDVASFVGCHNGTLYNEDELAKKYNVDTVTYKMNTSPSNPEITWETRRNKIDSEILLEIIYTSKNFKVLSDYIGAAALVFTNTNEPNVLYVFKGASKFYSYSQNAQELEERPLFYYKESKNSLYISSLQEPLEIIGGVANSNLFSFKQNCLYKITNGDIKEAEMSLISRANASQKDSYSDYGRGWVDSRSSSYKKPENEIKKITQPISNKNLNIHCEALLRNQSEYKDRVYFNKLRFSSNGHTITGIYSWIKNYGYYKVDEDSIEDAKEVIKSLVGKVFIKNEFIIDAENLDLTNDIVQKFIPFKTLANVDNNLHYFINGVKIITGFDYKMTYDRYYHSNIKTGIPISHTILSEIATHPVISLQPILNKDYQGVLFRSKLVKEQYSFFILGAEKIYTIENGNLTNERLNTTTSTNLLGDDLFNSVNSLDDLISKCNKEISYGSKVLSTTVINQLIKADDIDYSLVDESDENVEELSNEMVVESIIELSYEVEDLISSFNLLIEDTNNEFIIDKRDKLSTIKNFLETII